MLKIDHVSKVYRVGNQDFTALHNVSLEIPAGAFMSFVGPSGSGKTTLLNLLGGLDKPTKGHVMFRDYRLDELSREKLAEIRRQHIGFIFQSYNLLPVYTVFENILFPLLLNNEKESKVRERVKEIIHQVGLEPETHKKPSELSGGQCQRVAIARALIKKPDIVLADEPTANLDKENSLMILELMQQLNRDYKAAFIFSTHDEKVHRFVNREIRLEDGYVISDHLVESAPT
ncbi:MAG: ABC transporter ATP-binding protein [Candidatus Nitronauta litoralis]|uniref:ABC transporter ATP-binding protein n=1 Tax=Candidatus Nitronauta litoralis TaxID=2705533 RepID=A0A7T0BZR3_9BACT|nr:MAG: ABC transporter ATP-binding protein [Candidatus Nitronauta litoralis]